MTLHLGLSHSSSRTSEQQQEAREARRALKERVRSDWFYPALPAYQKPIPRSLDNQTDKVEEEVRIAGFRFHQPDQHELEPASNVPAELYFEPLEWREREYSSESSGDEESSPTLSKSTGSKQPQPASTWRFEGPDSVGTQIQDRRVALKSKRQRALEEETSWNEGLALFLARRDIWCGARTKARIYALEDRPSSQLTDGASDSPASSSPRSFSTADTAGAESTPSTSPELEPTATIPPISSRALSPQPDILIPVAPRILANHPIRRRITPAVYPEIYTKIIVQGRTPSVPLNLQTLTHALVQGWRTDGEWPPKPAPPEKAIGRRKSKDGEGVIKHGVRAVGRALKITNSTSPTTESGVAVEKG